jgi:ferredoxin
MILVIALAAVAGVFSITWGPVEENFSMLEIRANGAVLQSIEAEEAVLPEGTELIQAFYVMPETCIGCGLCISSCPVKAISLNDQRKAVIDSALCINCGLCASRCPVSAIKALDTADCSLYGIDADGNAELLQEGFEVDL